MHPLSFLAAMLAVTISALAAHLLQRRRTATKRRELATQWGMRYSATDRFEITPRVVDRFPIPGVSDVLVTDLIYLPEPEQYRYLFTVEFTQGVVRTKKRVRRVATFCEPRDRACPQGWSQLVLAPQELSLADQYRHLMSACTKAPQAAKQQETMPTVAAEATESVTH
jgi:hypothetical protein